MACCEIRKSTYILKGMKLALLKGKARTEHTAVQIKHLQNQATQAIDQSFNWSTLIFDLPHLDLSLLFNLYMQPLFSSRFFHWFLFTILQKHNSWTTSVRST